MNVNLYVIEDYKNETTLRPKKTNPIQTQFKPCPELAEALSAAEGAVEWANLETTPGPGRAKYNNDLTVHASEPGIVTSFKLTAGIGARPAFMPDGQMPRACYDNFVASVPTIVFPDKGAAGK